MGKRTTKAPKKKRTVEYDGATPLSPDEERACMTIARILVKVQARRAAANTAALQPTAGVTDA